MKCIKKSLACVMAVIVFLLSGCGAVDSDTKSTSSKKSASDTTAKSSKTQRHKVIIDTDAGSDDASALILAATSEQLDILGITVLYGNVPLKNAANNALMTLELCDVEAPVYIGAKKPLKKEREEMIPDPIDVACLIWLDMVLETKQCYGEACVGNDAAYGQVVLYQKGSVYEAMPKIGSYNLKVVTKIDTKLFMYSFMSVMTD